MMPRGTPLFVLFCLISCIAFFRLAVLQDKHEQGKHGDADRDPQHSALVRDVIHSPWVTTEQQEKLAIAGATYGFARLDDLNSISFDAPIYERESKLRRAGVWCMDCIAGTTPCESGGHGAIAAHQPDGSWMCLLGLEDPDWQLRRRRP